MNSINFDICGAERSGKTALISAFIQDSYRDTYHRTLGVHMGMKRVQLDCKPINLYLWDSIMYNKPESYSNSNFSSVDGLVFVLDCTNKESLG